MNYDSFDNYIIRTPLLSYSEISNLSLEKLIDLCQQPIISEAIYIASPELFGEMKKYINGIKIKDKERLTYTLLKYLLRMGNRCTPFGLFCGSAVGVFGESNRIEVNDFKKHKRHTQLDMNFLCALAQNLEENQQIRNQLEYYTNSSLYKVGEQLRYIEFRYQKMIRRHFTVSIDFSEYVERILHKARNGANIDELAKVIVEPDISIEEATEFINELVDSQILLSAISPSITGNNYFDIIKSNVKLDEFKDYFKKVDNILIKINSSPIEEGFKYYNELHASLTSFNIDYNKKYLLQTDLITSFKENTLSKEITKNIKEALIILNKLASFNNNSNLIKFKNAFYERYEDEEIPLAFALDVEAGIGYGTENDGLFDVSPLIDDLNFIESELNSKKSAKEIKWTQTDGFLYKKIILANKHNKKEIVITDKNLESFDENWGNIPNTFSVFLSILNGDLDSPLIYLPFAGGATAASILGRFCHSDKNTLKHVKNIIKQDEVLNDCIYAEISHLPENRVGNILHRPHLRTYEIPYLAKGTLPEDKQISINDIMISVKEDKIILRSKKLNKEILPRLSTAHNYSENSLPLYHLLCDLQTQNLRETLYFDWGNVYSFFDFFPRVSYKNIILSPAKWNIKKSDIQRIIKNQDITSWRKEKGIPIKVLLIEDDNELLIDLEHKLSVKMFISYIKNKNQLILSEYLFNPSNSLVKKTEKPFSNEVILAFYKNSN